jgi:hypothetical protein
MRLLVLRQVDITVVAPQVFVLHLALVNNNVDSLRTKPDLEVRLPLSQERSWNCNEVHKICESLHMCVTKKWFSVCGPTKISKTRNKRRR